MKFTDEEQSILKFHYEAYVYDSKRFVTVEVKPHCAYSGLLDLIESKNTTFISSFVNTYISADTTYEILNLIFRKNK